MFVCAECLNGFELPQNKYTNADIENLEAIFGKQYGQCFLCCEISFDYESKPLFYVEEKHVTRDRKVSLFRKLHEFSWDSECCTL